jgi:hypothetical protein
MPSSSTLRTPGIESRSTSSIGSLAHQIQHRETEMLIYQALTMRQEEQWDYLTAR